MGAKLLHKLFSRSQNKLFILVFRFFIEFSLNYTIQDYRTQCYYEALENNYYWKYEQRHLIFVYIHRIVMFYLFEHHLD